MKINIFVILLFWTAGSVSAEDCSPPSFYASLPRDREWFYGVARDSDPDRAREAAVRNLGKQVSGSIDGWDEKQVATIAGPGRGRAAVAEAVDSILTQTPLAGWEQDDQARCNGYSYVLVRVQKEKAQSFLAENAKFRSQLLERLDKRITQIGSDLESMKAAYAKLSADLQALQRGRGVAAASEEKRQEVERIMNRVKVKLDRGQADTESRKSLQDAVHAVADLSLEQALDPDTFDVAKVKAAISRGANPNRIFPNKIHSTVLGDLSMMACFLEHSNLKESDLVDALQSLFKHGLKIQWADSGILWSPIACGLKEYTRVLLEHGVSATEPIEEGTPIEVAAKHGHPEIADLLAKYGARRALPRINAQLRLRGAASDGDIKAMDSAIHDGAYVNSAGNDGETALVDAIKQPSMETTYPAVLYLLEHKADPNQKGQSGFRGMGMVPPLHMAILMSPRKEKLLPRFAREPVFARKILEALLSAGAHVSGKDENGETPLHVAARWNKLEAAELLIKSGALKDVRDNAGKTPLDLAESAEMIRLLQAPPSRLAEFKKILGF